MTSVVGVDGCPAGWVEARLASDGTCRMRVIPRLQSALEGVPAAVAVDMPIGLLDEPQPGGRACDRAARRLLGPRRASVFSPPPRPALRARSFDEVRGLGVSLQAYHLLPRLREVDALVTPQLQARIREAHPELAFARILGHPARCSKRHPEGRAERVEALQASGAFRAPVGRILTRALRKWPRRALGPDDVLDALALALTARHVSEGSARRVPVDPPRDAQGLRMEILH